MELRPGFKTTEAGSIPADWIDIPLREVATKVASGKSRVGSNLGDFPVHGSTGVIGRCAKGDYSGKAVLIARVGANAGRTNFVDGVYGVTDNTIIVRVGQSNHLEYFWRQLELKNLNSMVFGSGQPLITGTQIKNLIVPVPPTKSEQEAIAEALSDADALIESLEQLLAKKRLIKQGAMQELLTGKRRLPGFEKKRGFKDSDIGRIPYDWDVVKLGSCLETPPRYGINAAAIPFNNAYPTYLRITDITEDGKFSELGKASVNHPNTSSYVLQKDDIVFARTGASVGKSYLYRSGDGELVYAGFLIRVRPKQDRLTSAFLSFYAQTRSYWNWIKENSMRSGQPGVNGQQYASLLIPLPTIFEQTAIADILSDMDADIAALEAKLAKARQIKQGMMAELLTGRIRLV